MITFGSVCSGIEAASVAWHPLGWRAAWLSEIEPFPCSVLQHHYPTVPNYGDMTTLARRVLQGIVSAPDVLVGGTPCQAFSVAGLREGLADERGQLTISYVRLLDAIDYVRGRRGQPAAVAVWENVPGVLSSKDNAFGCFLGALAGEDDALVAPGGKWANAGCVFGPQRTIAWRVIDAQYFGVAQRRRRVFVVASARKGFDPTAVLFEQDGMRRDSAPGRETGQEVAGTIGASVGDWSRDNIGESCVAQSVALRGRDGGATAELGGDVATCLRASTGGGDKPHVLAPSYAIQAGALRTNPNSGPDGIGVQANIAYTLEARAEVQAVAFQERGRTNGTSVDVSVDLAYALLAPNGGSRSQERNILTPQMAVRRLTPRECERLQGFPDDYTLVPHRGKPAADGPRYKALGNSMAVPCMAFIGRRIAAQLV